MIPKFNIFAPLVMLGVLLGLCSPTTSWSEDRLLSLRTPLAKRAVAMPTFELDLSEVAENEGVKKWGEQAQELCEEWYPILCRFLATDDWKSPEKVRIVLKQEFNAPAATSGATIHVSVKWITNHPDDFGMMIHELTHVIQNYPPGQPGWLVEGIADYVRYWKYEPEMPRRRIDWDKAGYRDGYYTSGAFLAWVSHTYDRRLLRNLDAALKDGHYDDHLFELATGKPLATLWDEFKAAQQPRQK